MWCQFFSLFAHLLFTFLFAFCALPTCVYFVRVCVFFLLSFGYSILLNLIYWKKKLNIHNKAKVMSSNQIVIIVTKIRTKPNPPNSNHHQNVHSCNILDVAAVMYAFARSSAHATNILLRLRKLNYS